MRHDIAGDCGWVVGRIKVQELKFGWFTGCQWYGQRYDGHDHKETSRNHVTGTKTREKPRTERKLEIPCLYDHKHKKY